MRVVSFTRPVVTVVHHDLRSLMLLVVALVNNGFSVTGIDASRPLETASEIARGVVAVGLTGDEGGEELRKFGERAKRAGVLALSPAGEAARSLRAYGVIVLAADAPLSVIVASLTTIRARDGVTT